MRSSKEDVVCNIMRSWCDVIILNVHIPTDDKKESFCKELDRVLDHYLKHHMKILL
jgi:hypothetical protein